MKKNNQEVENDRLRDELKQMKRENKSLSGKLEKSNLKKSELQKELKKKDVLRLEVRKKQLQSLSNLLKDINIQNLSLD